MKLNNIPLRLDDRIFDIADIKTVITADENDVGKMGYFANSIHLFKNLEGQDGIKYGKLIYLSDLDYGGDKSDKCFVCSNQWAYRYFIPEDALKPEEPEKKYRPFTLAEWIGQHEVGEFIKFRNSNMQEFHVLYTGYIFDTNDDIQDIRTKGQIMLLSSPYSFQELFDNYEIKVNGEWQPFGVIDEEGAGE